jgi:hypothetical protein
MQRRVVAAATGSQRSGGVELPPDVPATAYRTGQPQRVKLSRDPTRGDTGDVGYQLRRYTTRYTTLSITRKRKTISLFIRS